METKHLRYPKVNEKHVLVTAVLKAAFNKRFYKAFALKETLHFLFVTNGKQKHFVDYEAQI